MSRFSVSKMFGLFLVAIYVLLYHFDSPLTFIPGLFMLFMIGQGVGQLLFPKIRLLKDPPLLREMVYVASGFMGSIFLITLLTFFHVVNTDVLMWVFVALAIAACLIASSNQDIRIPLTKETGFLAIILALGVGLMTYTRSYYGFPVLPGADPYHYMAAAYGYLHMSDTFTLFLNNNISEPMSYYAYLYQLTHLLKVSFLPFFYYGPFLALPFFGIQIYLLGRFLFKRYDLAFVGAVIGLTLVGSTHFYGAHDIYTTSITQMVFLSFWMYGLMAPKEITHTRRFWFSFLVLIGFLFIIYPFSIVVNVPLMTLLLRDKKIFKWLYGGTILVFVLAVIIQGREVWPTWSMDLFREQWSALGRLMRISYTHIHYILLGLGIPLLIFKSLRQKIHPLAWPIWGYTAVLALLFLSRYSHIASRLEWYFRPYMVLMMVIPFALFAGLQLEKKTRYLVIEIVLTLFVISQVFLGVTNSEHNYYVFKPTHIYGLGHFYMGGAISLEEFTFLRWVEENVNETDYIITDPYVGDLIRGFTHRMASSALIIPGGQSPGISGDHFEDLKRLNYEYLHEFYTGDPEYKEANLALLEEEIDEALTDHGYVAEDFLVLIMSRTEVWYDDNEENIAHGEDTLQTSPLKYYAVWPITFAEFDRDIPEVPPTWDPLYVSTNILLFQPSNVTFDEAEAS